MDVPLAGLFWPWRAFGSVPTVLTLLLGMRAWLRGISMFFMLNLAQHELSKKRKAASFPVQNNLLHHLRQSREPGRQHAVHLLNIWHGLVRKSLNDAPQLSCHSNDDGYPFTMTVIHSAALLWKSAAYSCPRFFLSFFSSVKYLLCCLSPSLCTYSSVNPFNSTLFFSLCSAPGLCMTVLSSLAEWRNISTW